MATKSTRYYLHIDRFDHQIDFECVEVDKSPINDGSIRVKIWPQNKSDCFLSMGMTDNSQIYIFARDINGSHPVLMLNIKGIENNINELYFRITSKSWIIYDDNDELSIYIKSIKFK